MLSPILDSSADDTAAIKPAVLADKLHISMASLASLLHIDRNRLADKASVVKVQSTMAPLMRILTLAEQATGNERRAILWFKFNPIPSLGLKTPMELVEDGKPDWVMAHIADVLNGVYA
jgi:uncharacterized protein (DUF2384 family)